MAEGRLLMGRIGAAHGVRGEVRITSYTQDPLAIAGYGPLSTDRPGLTIEILAARDSGNVVIARLKDVTDRTAAEQLNGVELYAERTVLPEVEDEDDFYHADLIGLEARLSDGTVLGTVSAVPNYGAGDLIEVRDPRSGDTFLYPFSRAVAPQVHVKDGYLVIAPPADAEPGNEDPD
jgi:16S rRNA processing protein RimM